MSQLGQKQTFRLAIAMSALDCEFNRSTQHLLILPEGRWANGVACTDMVHGKAKGRALGALEERSVCGGYRSIAWEEEQERRLSDLGGQWRNRSGATPESSGSAEA